MPSSSGTRPRLAHTAPVVGRRAADLLFDLVERADPAQHLLRHGVGVHRMQVVDIPARVSHTCGFLDAAVEIYLGIARERIGLQHAGEVSEMLLRMLTAAIGRVGEPDRQRFVGAARPPSRT
ncbi:hypothetical protein WT25_01990 [Burkholderia territorii]|nr:hypothetical protein WT25_01990 [Burkholderia territorii]